jgi:hypothetical protein
MDVMKGIITKIYQCESCRQSTVSSGIEQEADPGEKLKFDL